jgi:ribose transport system permease protein
MSPVEMRMPIREFISRFGTALAGLGVLLFFAAFAPGFASVANLANVLGDTAFLAILALGFTLAFKVAQIDLSIAVVGMIVVL